jgi:acetyl esterase/lipase
MMANTSDKHEVLQPIDPSMDGNLDPVFVELYNKHVANTPLKPIDLSVLRKNYSVLYSYGTAPAPDVAKVYDFKIVTEDGASLDVRIYEPDTPGPWPVHIDYHGGGWGLGDLDTEAHICKHICADAKVVVIDVAYRLVPEHPFPTGIEDSFAALKYIHKHGSEKFNIDPTRISVGGVSAGACIALACAHLARDASVTLKLVAAGTPTIDDISKYEIAADSPFKSMQENEHAPTLNWGELLHHQDYGVSCSSVDDRSYRPTQVLRQAEMELTSHRRNRKRKGERASRLVQEPVRSTRLHEAASDCDLHRWCRSVAG